MNCERSMNQRKLNECKKDELEENISRYGLSGLHVMDMVDGRISAGELYDKLIAAQKEQLEKISYAYDKDFISFEDARSSANKVINGRLKSRKDSPLEKKDTVEEEDVELKECPADEDTL